MKKALRVAAWFIGLLLVSNEVSAAFGRWLVSSWITSFDATPPSWLHQNMALEITFFIFYSVLFVVVGAIMSSRVSRLSHGFFLSAGLGLSFSIIIILSVPMEVNDVNLLFAVIYFAPYYIPTLAGAAGSLLWYGLSHSFNKLKEAKGERAKRHRSRFDF